MVRVFPEEKYYFIPDPVYIHRGNDHSIYSSTWDALGVYIDSTELPSMFSCVYVVPINKWQERNHCYLATWVSKGIKKIQELYCLNIFMKKYSKQCLTERQHSNYGVWLWNKSFILLIVFSSLCRFFCTWYNSKVFKNGKECLKRKGSTNMLGERFIMPHRIHNYWHVSHTKKPYLGFQIQENWIHLIRSKRRVLVFPKFRNPISFPHLGKINSQGETTICVLKQYDILVVWLL